MTRLLWDWLNDMDRAGALPAWAQSAIWAVLLILAVLVGGLKW